MATAGDSIRSCSLSSFGVTTVRAAVGREPWLAAVGLGGIALAVTCLIGVAVNGRLVAPEGDLFGAATFDFGVGVYTLTVAALLPLARYSTVARRRWRWAHLIFIVYGLTLETVQAFRGLDPRFTEEGGAVDSTLGAVFGATAGLNTILFVILAVRFVRPDVLADRTELRLGIRYGAIAVALSFGVGVVMSLDQGRHIGEEGNLLLPHGLGVHGLQTIPLVALLVVSAGKLTRPDAWIHVAGAAWLTACAAAFAQALLGHPPLDGSGLTAAIIGALAIWAAIVARSAVTLTRRVLPLIRGHMWP